MKVEQSYAILLHCQDVRAWGEALPAGSSIPPIHLFLPAQTALAHPTAPLAQPEVLEAPAQEQRCSACLIFFKAAGTPGA
eukprot:5494382-Amphidinium_carterae.1